MHNENDQSGVLTTRIYDTYGDDMFTVDGGQRNWTIKEGETYTDYFERVSDQLYFEGDQMVAYIINNTITE